MNAKRVTKGPRNARAMFVELQSLLLADCRNPKTAPSVRAQCARAIEVIEERMRILNGKPLPGQLRPDVPDKYRRTKQGKAPALLALPTEDAPASQPASQPKSS